MASVHQRYRILSKLDAGGMAEIYRGVAISIEGFEKPVAIKRILPSLCQNQKFVTMFLDEARLSMQLNHANIVQIFDLGQVGDTYFVAMEMVEGANLRRVMQRSVDLGLHIPVPIGCFLIMETAKALAYAHEKTGPNDQPLGIVHRDVSPPNVLLSRQGEVKLTDFGLARAATNAQVTDQGVVKGKYAYLSPEAADGKPVDPRADIYSCGIILWELLCGRRLFAGKSDPDTVELVRQGVIPKPSSVRPEVDEELERIVLRALAKNVKRRYQSARELEQDLAAYLFKNNLRVTGNDLAAFLRLTAGEGQLGESQVDIGALLRAEIDPEDWLGFGLDPEITVWFGADDALVARSPASVSARFPDIDRMHLGGLLWPEAAARLARTAYATHEPVGRGQVILFNGAPAFRRWTTESERLLVNAILLGPGLGTRWSTPW